MRPFHLLLCLAAVFGLLGGPAFAKPPSMDPDDLAKLVYLIGHRHFTTGAEDADIQAAVLDELTELKQTCKAKDDTEIIDHYKDREGISDWITGRAMLIDMPAWRFAARCCDALAHQGIKKALLRAEGSKGIIVDWRAHRKPKGEPPEKWFFSTITAQLKAVADERKDADASN